MTRKKQRSKPSMAVRLCIWTIRHQTWIAGQVRIYIYAAVAVLALLALADVISIQAAVMSTFCGGSVVLGVIWTLVRQRRSMLLNIQEPEIRELVHHAMLTYLHQIDPALVIHVDERRRQGDHEEDCKECNMI